MGKMKIDLRDEVVLLAEGEHVVEVLGVELKTAASDSQYLNIRVEVVESENAGAMLYAIASLRPDMLRLFRRQMRALGVDDDELTLETEEVVVKNGRLREVEHHLVEPDLVGRRAIAVVVHDEWEGEMRAKVKTLKAAQ